MELILVLLKPLQSVTDRQSFKHRLKNDTTGEKAIAEAGETQRY